MRKVGVSRPSEFCFEDMEASFFSRWTEPPEHIVAVEEIKKNRKNCENEMSCLHDWDFFVYTFVKERKERVLSLYSSITRGREYYYAGTGPGA